MAKAQRVFKSSGFAKNARKAKISDDELCEAFAEIVNGQCDDLGGGVFKKRLNKNMHRGIILAEGKMYWVYEYLFAKKDCDNIDVKELAAFRELAKAYAKVKDGQLKRLLNDHDLVEICYDSETKVQK